MAGKICPLLKKACVEHGCAWYTHIQGTHPQTGVLVDSWACAIAWMPTLQIETAKEARGAGASTDKLHNLISGRTQRAAQIARQGGSDG